MSEISAAVANSSGVRVKARPSRKSWKPNRLVLVGLQIGFLVALALGWYVFTEVGILPRFFFGNPILVVAQIWAWFVSGEIFLHLGVTLAETVLGFIIGAVLGIMGGIWLGLSPVFGILFDPYIKAINAMPRVILGPIFILWFGLGVMSKVALGVSLVYFVVFFNVIQGVREVSNVILANARMLGASKRQLLFSVYIPSALSWVFSSLHTSVGMAFVGAVVGEYLGSASGIGYLILQAESTFDVNAVFAGMLVLTLFALLLDGAITIIEKQLIGRRSY